MQLNRNLSSGVIEGTTENIHLLRLALNQFTEGSKLAIRLDGRAPVIYTTQTANDSIYLAKSADGWSITTKPVDAEKGPHRYGTFKEGFNNRMVYVYGTIGSKTENQWAYNKARLDAETWYYRGNGAVDIISDKEYLTGKYAGRGVVLLGNQETNAAWNLLLSEAPIRVTRKGIHAGQKNWAGDDLAAYFVWPLKNSRSASVAVITGNRFKGPERRKCQSIFRGWKRVPGLYDL